MQRPASLTLAFVFFTTAFAFGQDDPQLTIRTSGPAAPTRAMVFSKDSQRLYVGGLDKTLHVYEVGWDAKNQGPPVVTYGRPILWELTRGDRGQIFSVSVCPSRDELLLAGAGARQQTGDIAMVDLTIDAVAGSMPTPLARVAAATAKQIGLEGHVHLITNIHYSPSGDAVISRDEAGALFLWRRGPAGFGPQQLLPPSNLERFSPLAIFLDETSIVYSRREPTGDVRLIRRKLDSGSEVTFPENYPRRVAALAMGTVADAWASADDIGNINLTSISNPNQRSLLRASLPHVTAMSIGGPKWLAVVSVSEIDGLKSESMLDLFDLTTRRRAASVSIGTSELTRAVAVSPNGQFVASINEDDQSVLVWRIDDLISGNQQPNVVDATSHQVMELLRSPDGQAIAFGPDSTSLKHVLDFKHAEIRTDSTPKSDWVAAVEQPALWQITLLDQPVTTIDSRSPDGTVFRVQIDPLKQGTIVRHCFLFDPNIPQRVIGIAVGTENINGIFVYQFDASEPLSDDGRRPAKLVRWFRDHTAAVTALLPTLDGKSLVSGSRDRTIKLWSLEDLFQPVKGGFVHQTLWGCDFATNNSQVVTQNVVPGGIAFSKGLRDGDVITRVQGRDINNPDRLIDAVAERESANQILRTLAGVSVLEQILINANPVPVNGIVGKPKAFIIRPAWEPVLTGFVNDAGEWAIWHPDGYFNASAAEGGGLFRWLLNRGQDQPPRVLDGGFLSKEFERPDIIEKLLSGVRIDLALGVLGPGNDPLVRTISEIPDVQIIEPKANQSLTPEQDNRIVARIDFGSADRADYEIRGSVDAIRLGVPAVRDLGNNQIEATWMAQPTGRLNQIEVLASQRGGSLVSFYSNDVVYRWGQTENPTPYQLHVLSLASEAYDGELVTSRSGFGKLDYPIDDVQAVIDRLDAKQKEGLGSYRLGHIISLEDHAISPQSVSEAITRLNRVIQAATGPQLLVVYLSGHGTTLDGEYYYVTTSTKSPEEKVMRRDSLPWKLLASAGPSDCRVVIMIDTCHSGTAVDVKSSLRDPIRSGSVVVAAASGREAARELSLLQHGCFSHSVLLALDGKADSDDGIVDLEELIDFVKENVMGLTGGQQTPSASPLRLADVLKIPLVLTDKR